MKKIQQQKTENPTKNICDAKISPSTNTSICEIKVDQIIIKITYLLWNTLGNVFL